MRRGIEDFWPETVRLNLLRAVIASEVLEGLDRECREGRDVRVIRREIISPPVVTNSCEPNTTKSDRLSDEFDIEDNIVDTASKD